MKDVLFLNTHALIEQHWTAVDDLIAAGVRELTRGEWSTGDLAELVNAGSAFAVLMFEDGTPRLAMVFEFRHYPKRTSLNVMALGGADLVGAAVSFWPQFVAWAKESGATQIEACASLAMTRVLRGLGFEHEYNLLRIEV